MLAEIMKTVSDTDFTLERDLKALALADGKLTEEEKQTLLAICPNNDREVVLNTKKEKENYLVKMIRMMGADGESATLEIIFLEMIASKLGYSKMRLISLVLLNATRKNFPNDYGAKVLLSYLANMVDPKGKSDKQNHDNIAKVFDDIAQSIPASEDPKEDRAILEKAFARVSRMMLEDNLLVQEFSAAGLELRELLEFEGKRSLKKWARQ